MKRYFIKTVFRERSRCLGDIFLTIEEWDDDMEKGIFKTSTKGVSLSRMPPEIRSRWESLEEDIIAFMHKASLFINTSSGDTF